MIILHNQQLQNQCLRPYPSPSQTNLQLPLQSQRSALGAQMRKSFSSASPLRKTDSRCQSRERNKLQVNKWIANHFLSDVKQKFKEIFKQRSQNDDEGKKKGISPRKNSTKNGRRLLNLSLNCEPATITDKKMLFRQLQPSYESKKKRLIDIKKGRLFKGTHRDYKDFISKASESWMPNSQLSQRVVQDDPMEEEEREDSYLSSQYAFMHRKAQIRDQERTKTEKRTIEPANHQPSLNKYESEMLSSAIKRHSDFPNEDPLHMEVKQSLLSQMRCKLINDDHFSVRKRNSLTRRQQKKKQYARQFRSKASLQLNLEV